MKGWLENFSASRVAFRTDWATRQNGAHLPDGSKRVCLEVRLRFRAASWHLRSPEISERGVWECFAALRYVLKWQLASAPFFSWADWDQKWSHKTTTKAHTHWTRVRENGATSACSRNESLKELASLQPSTVRREHLLRWSCDFRQLGSAEVSTAGRTTGKWFKCFRLVLQVMQSASPSLQVLSCASSSMITAYLLTWHPDSLCFETVKSFLVSSRSVATAQAGIEWGQWQFWAQIVQSWCDLIIWEDLAQKHTIRHVLDQSVWTSLVLQWSESTAGPIQKDYGGWSCFLRFSHGTLRQ